MAHPKKKMTHARSHKRKSAWMGRLGVPNLVPCPKCQTPKMPHQVCSNCGTYKGEQVIEVEHKPTRRERRAAEKAATSKEKKAEKEDKA